MNYTLNNQLDATDKRILGKLIKNARLAFSQLAENLKISNSLVHQRVKKLQELGVIDKATFSLSPGALGYETCAFTQIIISEPKLLYPIVAALRSIPEVVECVNIAGRYAIMVKIYAVNNTHLRDVVYEKIQTINGVEGTNTVVSFETAFIRNVALEIPGTDNSKNYYLETK